MDADPSTARCPACASVVAPGAPWCGLCLRPIPVPPVVDVFASTGPLVDPEDRGFRTVPPATRSHLFSESRWRSGTLTFGPVGRLVLTICVLLPYPIFLINLPFGIVGVVVWSAVAPRALRDIWRRDRRHHLPPPS